MKLSISLSNDEVAALDRYARSTGLASRSAAIQQAIRLLEDPELEESYAAAWGRVGGFRRRRGVGTDRGRRALRCCAVRSD